MPSYDSANRTKDFFQDKLLREHPEIVSIAPQLQLDGNGEVTEEAVIVVGVSRRSLLHKDSKSFVPSPSQRIPTALPAIDERGRFVPGDEIPVIILETGDIVAHQENTARMRPCPGGFSVGHRNGGVGTYGGNVRLGANYGFILSCNHVLANSNEAAEGDEILQPGVGDGGNLQDDIIARLDRWVPINFAGGENEVDCAIAQAVSSDDISRNVQGIGIPSSIANPSHNQEVRKSGRTTGLTTGRITSLNATTRVRLNNRTAIFVNQLQYTRMSAAGDSGSLVWDLNTLSVVGLHTSGDDQFSYGNRILRVLELLSRAFSIDISPGKTIHFKKADISLIDI